MIRNQLRTCRSFLTPCLLGLSLFVLSCSGATEKHEILEQARNAYYNLHRQGLKEFRATIQPNWSVMLDSLDPAKRTREPAAFDSEVVALNRIHFTMMVDSLDRAQVTHSPDPPAATDKINYPRTVRDVEKQMLDFFESWSPFVLTALVPADSVVLLEGSKSTYLITIKEGAATISITLSKDFLIEHLVQMQSGVMVLITPRFTKTKQGLLVSDCDITLRQELKHLTTNFSCHFDYQDINGLSMLRTMTVLLPAEHAYLDFSFSDYNVTKN